MDISENISNSFLRERFGMDIIRTKHIIENFSIGDYTKSYETYKRMQNIIKYFKEEVKNKKGAIEIVDIGCGNGYYIFMLNLLFKLKDRAHFYGIDISPAEIQFAETLKRSLNADNAAFDVGDAENIMLPDDSFDIVICCELIEHLAHPENCLKEIKRILKPGGLAIITTPNKSNPIFRISRIFKVIYKQADSFTPRPVKPRSLERGWRAVLGYFSPKPRALTRGAGFTEIRELTLGTGHISTKGLKEWIKIIRAQGFKIEGIGRGSMIAGGTKYNTHPILFSIVLILDRVFDWLPFTLNFTENITFKLRKPKF